MKNSSDSESDETSSPCLRPPPVRTNRMAMRLPNMMSNIPPASVYTSRIDKLSEIKKMNIEKMLATLDSEWKPPPEKKIMKEISKNSSDIENTENIKLNHVELNDDSPSPPPPPENIFHKKKLQKSSIIALKKYHSALKKVTDSNKYKPLSLDLDVEDDSITEKEINKYVTIKIRWKSEIMKFVLEKADFFSKIITELSSKLGVPSNLILLSKGDNSIHSQDTPDSIGLTIADILDCLVVNPQLANSDSDDSNNITLKLQAFDSKSKTSITIKKTDHMSLLMTLYAKERQLPLSNIVFKFDGDILNEDDTPEDLDLEDDECIDVIVL